MVETQDPAIPQQRKGADVSGPMPWWGDRGPAPHIQWPGVTIEIPAVWSADRRRWESPDGKYYFDQAAADKAVEFFPTFLSHHMGEFAGRPFELLDYQKKLLTRPLRGWKKASNGLRRFRKVFGFIPKGGGKSPWAAGTGLDMLICDDEPAAEVYATAADKLQARTVHDNAKIMVEESPDLLEECEVLKDAIYHRPSRSTFKVLSSDAKTKHSFRPHVAIFDELHAHPNRDLFEALSKSMKKRRQPLMIIITHAGTDDEGICYEEYELAKSVLSGTNPDEGILPVIFEAKPEDDWTSPDVWRRVNPGHGITIQHDGVVSDCGEAIAEPRKRNDFFRFTLNRWVNQAEAWMPVDWWDQCPADFDESRVARLACFGGLDLSEKIDLSAFVLVFKEMLPKDQSQTIVMDVQTEDGEPQKKELSLNYRLHVLPRFWIPEATMQEHERVDKVPYSQWVEKKWVIPTEGEIIHYDRIFDEIVALSKRFPMLRQAPIGYDPDNATQLALHLQDKGFKVTEVSQGYGDMNEPCRVIEALMKAGRFVHNGNRCARNHVENCAIKREATSRRIRPVKGKKQSKRIDFIPALADAIKVLIDNPHLGPRPYTGLRSVGA